MAEVEPVVMGARDRIVAKAKELATKYKDSAYYSPEKKGDAVRDTSNFDCSYFVYLVIVEIFSDYKYLNTAAIRTSPNFKKVDIGAPGDLILFPAGQVPYAVKKKDTKVYPNHVGILLDASSWVGRQSSSLGTVLLSNPWWGSRANEYYRHIKIDAAQARANGTNLRKYFA
jgi:cell wall-associated NlpC family hydrolase